MLCPLSSNSSQILYIAKMWLGAPGRGMAIIREARHTQGQPISTAPTRRSMRIFKCMLYPVLVLTVLKSSHTHKNVTRLSANNRKSVYTQPGPTDGSPTL
jgi:hypothetical protein